MSIVGCDDIELASLVVPSLTTVAIPARELGARAARLLLQGLTASDAEPRTGPRPQRTIASRLIVRGTIAAPRRDAAPAAGRALKSAGVEAAELDLIIVATDTPEYISLATVPVVQARIGAWKAGAFDINSACAGFVTALDVAWKYIRADERYNRVLVVGAYAMSKFVDQHDKKTSTIFADGAGAVVLESSSTPGILASELFAEDREIAIIAHRKDNERRRSVALDSGESVYDP